VIAAVRFSTVNIHKTLITYGENPKGNNGVTGAVGFVSPLAAGRCSITRNLKAAMKTQHTHASLHCGADLERLVVGAAMHGSPTEGRRGQGLLSTLRWTLGSDCADAETAAHSIR
jgi:hypothetical protein